MITIIVPILPSIFAVAALVSFVCMVSEEGGTGLVGAILPFICSAATFFMVNGIISLFG